ncbi:MAG: hypothetical protein M3R32_03190 [Chloroflexota bacterium]|nr:hypothetical protein [Chloroflexota bacterium]
MSGPGQWLARGAATGNAAADRTDQWLGGSIGALSYLAWLPLLLTVTSLPRASDLAFMGARLFSSGSFPWNVLLLASLATGAVVFACLLAALGEAVLLRGAGRETPGRSLARETEAAFSVVLMAALPAIVAVAILATGVAVVAPAEFGAPDLGAPLWLRIAAHLVPLLAVLAVLIVLGQAIGAAALRRAIGPDAMPVGAALRSGLRDLVRRPATRLGLAIASMVIDLLSLVLATGVLRVLWAPIRVELGGGHLVSPQALLLLVGFVAIWLTLVLALGAIGAWVSAWWSLELAPADAGARPEGQEVIS